MDPAALAWTRNDMDMEAKPYVKFVMPSGNLSRAQLKDLVVRMDLPHTKEMVQLVDIMYRHHLNTATSAPPKLPRDSPIFEGLARYWESISSTGAKYKAEKDGPKMLEILYRQRFKVLMNDSSTYDTPLVAARNRVQAPRGKSDNFLPIPTAKRTEAPDRRYTAGIYNSARDLLDRRKYMSVAGGPFGEYQIDLLDMGVKGKLYNKQFWYLLTALNTNSRYVYACPVKKGADAKKGETKLSRQEDRNLSNEPIEEPRWIERQIIPAMQRIMAQIDADLAADTRGVLTHRRIKSVMMDSGAEFQVTFRAWLADQGISSVVCAPETHEQMSRLNSFHRYFRQRYNVQWRKYFEDPRGYGGPVRWINPRADQFGFAAAPSEDGLIESQEDAAAGLADMPDLPDEEAEEQDDDVQEGGAAAAPAAADLDTWDEEYAPEEQKLATQTGVWRVTYWQDWVNAHNTTVKAQSLRGAEVRETKKNGQRRTLRLAKAPADITDEMVDNLVRYDAGRREVVKQRVDQWIRDHAVVTQADLPAGKEGLATRVRLDLNRSKYGTEVKQKGTTFLSIWSERHYPLAARVGTNTFEVDPRLRLPKSVASISLAHS